MRPSDPEGALKAPPLRRRKRRASWRMPLSIGLGAVAIFIFFVILGKHSGRSSNLGSDRRKNGDLNQPQLFTYEVVAEFPHDPKAFTQGLEYYEWCTSQGGTCAQLFYESTGLLGRSSVREVDVATGRVLRARALPKSDFGEGLTRIRDTLYQVTWQTNRAWSYDIDNFEHAKEIRSPLSDGWGVTSNGTHLIIGDSSDTLFFVDPNDMSIVRKIPVSDNGRSVKWLNELEWVDGLIYGNVFTTDCIAQVDPASGNVVGWIVLQGLKERMLESLSTSEKVEKGANAPEVLNGIAWDAKNSRLFVTGKLWPRVYQIKLRPLHPDNPKIADMAIVTQRIRDACIANPNAMIGR